MKRHVKRYNCEIQNAEVSHDGCDIGGVTSVKPRRGSLSCKKPFHLFVLMVWTFASVSFADVSVTGVTVRQLEPWGRVEIAISIAGSSNNVADAICTFTAMNGATNVALPIEHLIDRGVTAGCGEMWTRTYIWNAFADVGAVKINDVALTVEARLSGVQLWENGPYWAECNVGATKPEEYGYYFKWGSTTGYTYDNGTWVSSKGVRMSSSPFSKYSSVGYYVNATGNLTAACDAATAHRGAPWRMPTRTEMQQLLGNCTITFTTRNGVYGLLATGKGGYSTKSLFLPAAGRGDGSLYYLGLNGFYWSSESYTNYSVYDSVRATALEFDSHKNYGYYVEYLGYGQSVRPLREFDK